MKHGAVSTVIALGGPLVATLLALTDIPDTSAALLFLLAVGIAAYLAGPVYALLAAALSFLAFNYLVTPPKHSLGVLSRDDAIALAVFMIVALAMTAIVAAEQRLREEADASRRRAETVAERMRRLESVGRSLLEADSPQDVLDVILTKGIDASGARAGLIGLLNDDGETIDVVASVGYDQARIDAWRTMGIDDPLPLAEAVRTREPIFIATTAERNRRYPALAPVQEAKSHALVCLPLAFEGRPIGGLALSFEREEHFDANRRMLNVVLAAQAAQALQRARMRADEQLLRDRLAFLADASKFLSTTFDYEAALRLIVELAVLGTADWCTVDFVDADGRLELLAAAHRDSAKTSLIWDLRARFPLEFDAAEGVPAVIRSGEPEFTPVVADEPDDDEDEPNERSAILRELGLGSSIVVPFIAPGRVHGALTLASAEARAYTQIDLELAVDLANRIAVAIDNSLLYREAELRADAARALRYVADGVVLLGEDEEVRFMNPAAARLLAPVGSGEADVAEGWAAVRAAIARAAPAEATLTVPVALPEGERWLRISRGSFAEGEVFALHDVTEEWALERTRSDFVATASHELRTPLAAVYGSIQTLLREDLEMREGDRRAFLELSARECRRLTQIIDDLLLAGQLDQGQLRLDEAQCDLRELAAEVVETVAMRASADHELEVDVAVATPVRCDVARLRQALLNLVDNAVKYSPAGGRVTVRIAEADSVFTIEVEDEGLGIPADEQSLVFEKFYRLDPELSRGVGGAGLGLYITRQLIERMDGRLDLRSEPGHGSTFTITLPARRAA
jgi:signal transduction histidine kinase